MRFQQQLVAAAVAAAEADLAAVWAAAAAFRVWGPSLQVVVVADGRVLPF